MSVITSKPIEPINYQGALVIPYSVYLEQYNDLVASRELYRQRASELKTECDALLEQIKVYRRGYWRASRNA